MNWLRKKMIGWLSQGSDTDQEEIGRDSNQPIWRNTIPVGKRKPGVDSINKKGLRFTLYPAMGGHILETHQYNPKTDEHEGTLYMIKEEDDFAKQVAESITVELLKQ